MLQLPLDIQLDSSARLDNFYLGNNQQLLHRLQCLDTARENFIFVWGTEQVGKSHLAQGICTEYSTKDLVTAYFPLDNSSLSPEVLEGFEFANIVCLDSFDSVSHDLKWQTAIFNLYNNLKSNHRQLIIFAKQSPQTISLELADLKSRLNSMEIYKLEGLTEEQQKDFLISTAKYRGLEITQDVAHFILARENREVSNLIKLVELLDSQSLVQQRKVTVPFVKKILSL